MASEEYSQACCAIPPVQAKYKDKGTFIELDGMKTYKTGSEKATSAIILIYDIFGFSGQIQQGADLLAHATSSEKHTFQVFIPGFLGEDLADPAWFPPDTKEKQMKMGNYFGTNGPANDQVMLGKLKSVVEKIKEENKGIVKFAVVGYCWGAKIVSLATVNGTPFSVAAEVHPSELAVSDAPKITVPICVLASQDEDKETVAGFEKALTVPNYVETYPEAPHGWMTSRGDLEDPKGKADYERGYATVLNFFHQHL